VHRATKISSTTLPSAGLLTSVRKYTTQYGLSMVKTSIFRHQLTNSLRSVVRPPSKKHLGKNLRVMLKVPIVPAVWNEMTSTARGLAETSKSENLERVRVPWDPMARQDTLVVKPTTSTSTRRVTKLKLMRGDNVAALCSFENSHSGTSIGATRLLIKKVAAKTHEWKSVCMASQIALTSGWDKTGPSVTIYARAVKRTK
jgi:hypothetical protein